MKILATGIDTLEVGYEVDQFRDEMDLDCLKLFKNYAIEDRKEIPIELYDQQFVISYLTPQRYTYYLHNADIQITILDRFSKNRDYPEVHVKYLSPYLWTHGMINCNNKVDTFVNKMFWVAGSKISRADLTVDIAGPLPKTERNQFVTRLRKKQQFTTDNYTENLNINRYAYGTRDSGYIVGLTDIKLRQYSKDDEILLSGKKYFETIWETNGRENKEKVTRTEFQCNRDFLKKWKINTTDDLIGSMGSIWEYLTHKSVRICIPKTDINRARWENTPIWDEIQNVKFKNYPGLNQIERNKWNKDRAITMMRGYMMSLQAHGEDIDSISKEIQNSPEYADDLIRKMSAFNHIN